VISHVKRTLADVTASLTRSDSSRLSKYLRARSISPTVRGFCCDQEARRQQCNTTYFVASDKNVVSTLSSPLSGGFHRDGLSIPINKRDGRNTVELKLFCPLFLTPTLTSLPLRSDVREILSSV
jgi:hypothetical protein